MAKTAAPAPVETLALESLAGTPSLAPSSSGAQEATHEYDGGNLPPVDRGRGAYTYLFASFLFETTTWGGAYAYGVFQEYHTHNPASALYGKASPAATSAVGTLVLAGLHFSPLLTRGFFRTNPHLIKRTSMCTIIIAVVSLIIASFCGNNIGALIAFQGIIYGVAAGITFTAVILWLPQWFDKRRGTASGVIYAGSAVGGTVFPLIINALLQRVGFAWTVRIQAAYTLALMCIAIYLIRPRLPIPPKEPEARRSLLRSLAPDGLRVLLRPLSLLYIGILVFHAGAFNTVSLYLSSYTTSLGFSAATGTGVLSAFNACAFVSFLTIGRLIDALSTPVLMSICATISALSAFFFWGFSNSLVLLIIFTLVFGATAGGFTTFLTPAAKDISSMNNQETSTVYLALIFLRGIAVVIFPLIAGTIYDAEKASSFHLYGMGGFRGLVIFTGCMMFVPGALAMVVSRYRKSLLASGTTGSTAE